MASGFPIVGIGASAGGVEALETFFRAMPRDHGMAFVVITHLSPNRESLLAEILGRTTWMPVFEARDGAAVMAEQVHVLPAGATLGIADSRLSLRSGGEHARAPIDLFFTTLAEDQGENAIGIVLSGGGHDGTLGLKAIKERGGLTVAQGANATRPRFAEMPQSAAAAGFVDLILPVEKIPGRLVEYVRRWHQPVPERPSDGMARVYRLLRARTGHDFSQYRDRTFQRRVQRRMQVAQIDKIEDYIERLESDPNEAGALFRDLLIGVTGFFRDPAAFQALEASVIPKIFAGKGAVDEVRIWVSGCATGEEAYSLAILCAERAEAMAASPKICIFATDIDEAALTAARSGCYPAALLKDVAPERLRRFFTAETGTYRVAREMREMCIFSTHSVIRDPPFSRLDLVSCRNLLIYFKTPLQAQIIPLFHYALKPGGFLFLGPSENVSRFSELFEPIDKRHRIFQRHGSVARTALPFAPFLPQSRDNGAAPDGQGEAAPHTRVEPLRRFAAAILDDFAPVYVIVDGEGETLLFSAGTGKYLQAAPGPPTSNVVAMARPGLRADLRATLRRAHDTGQRAACEQVSVQVNGGVRMVGLAVQPLSDTGGAVYGIVFTDQGPAPPADARQQRASNDTAFQQLERELEESRERLQATIEELETANEEFRSSNEELISVNEELQSTNEEMETSKEELQAVNEELQTVNAELSSKIEELDRANTDLTNFIQSTQIATLFLDRNLMIRNFTPAVTKIFNLIPSDRGRPLSDMVRGVNYPDIETEMRAVLAGDGTRERSVSVTLGTGHYLARVLPYRALGAVIDGVILTFVDITNLVVAEEKQKTLTGELNHRVKNTLAVVCSIAERTLPQDAAKETLLGRLYALAQTHDLLTRTSWTDLPLRDLIAAELAPYRNTERGNMRIEGPPVMLRPRTALTLALAIHELATNAAKYGALSSESGWIEITWMIAGSDPGRLQLSWVERGGPEVAPLPKRGFGTELIERIIPFELQGEATLEVVDKAVRCTIAIPATPDHFVFRSAARAAN